MNIRAPISFAVMFTLLALLAGGLVGTVAALFVFSMSVAGATTSSGSVWTNVISS